MRNLPIPANNDKNILHKFINSKKEPYKKRLLRIPFHIKSRYDQYDENSVQLELIKKSVITQDYAIALTKCYTSNTAELSNLRSSLLYPDLEDFDACPFCGISEPTTLDHYLPKELFPEFSVLSKNLIPICSVCNSNYKGTKWIEKGERLFLHSYYDIIPDEYFLDLSVVIAKKISLTFSSKQVASEPDFSKLFQNHFKHLNLNERFKRKAASEISRKRKTLDKIYSNNNSLLDVSRALKSEADQLEENLSKNHWKTVLYKALYQSNDFCDRGFNKQVVR
ncbi:hypothetical protein [Aeromonas hydrophila]|uniref:hypothetical protein n=1 Tax=Aeromonas hydrophila TaxID=644 RepID=UPI0038CFCFC0